MRNKILALYDDRPFFERALQHGVKKGIITREKVNEILDAGPQGIIQIAQTFGTEHLRPDLLSARHRIVNLVSLFLESQSRWDLEKAAHLLAEHTFLSQSKGGSDMIKAIHRLPETSILGPDTYPSNIKDCYDTYAPGNPMGAKLSERYKNDSYIRNKNENTIKTALWLAGRFEHLEDEDLSGCSAEGVIMTLLLSALQGFDLRTLPKRKDIPALIEQCRQKDISWSQILWDIPESYGYRIRKIGSTLQSILKKTPLSDDDMVLFESANDDIQEISEHDEQVSKKWMKFTIGKNLSSQEKQTILFTALAGWKPQTEITETEAKRMIQYLTDNTPSYEECIDYFFEHNVPFGYHEDMRQQWSRLERDMDTIYRENVPMKTKLWILKEAGCNFQKWKKKVTSTKK